MTAGETGISVPKLGNLAQADEAHEREPIPQLIFGLIIGQGVERLQHQQAKDQHDIEWWASPLAAVVAWQRRIELRAEQVEIDHCRDSLQRITGRR